ncbi:hypothetical protein [Streptosporangium roseum]|uniref:hypothetical protein n=1 Tax=Streptosporangium roseum TaxID=2001 RepID=UPI0033204CFE
MEDLGSSVLAALAAAGEPVDAGAVATWLGLAHADSVRPGLNRPTGCDLAHDGHGGVLRALAALLHRRLAAAVLGAHSTIADHYLALWGGLGNGLPALAAHPRLGDADGGYGFRHLVHHLLAAGRAEEVHRLLACEQPAGQGRPGVVNVWFDARHRAGQVDGYLRDLEAAAGAARRATDAAADSTAPSLGLEMRYTLMRVCAEQADRPRRGVALMLLEAGLWDRVRALNDVRRLPSGERGRALLDMLPHLPEEQRPRVLHEVVVDTMTAVQGDPSVDTDLLAEVAALLSPQGMRRAVAAVSGLESPQSRIVALAALAPHLTAEAMCDALAVARTFQDEFYRAWALQELAPFLTAGPASEALRDVRAMPSSSYRDAALIALIPRQPEDLRGSALAEVREFSPEALGWCWIEAIMLLPEHRRRTTLARVVERAAPDRHVELLVEAAGVLPPGERDAVLAEALAVSHTITDRDVRERSLVSVAALLPAGARDQVVTGLLTSARTLVDEDDRARLLIDAAELAPPKERVAPLTEAVALARKTENATLLIRAAALLPADHPARNAALGQALEIRLQDVSYENYFAYGVLDELCPLLTDELMAVLVHAIQALERPGYLGRFLSARAEHLAGVALEAGLDAARSFSDPTRRALALTALSDRLPVRRQYEVLEEALTAARSARRCLGNIALRLPPERRRALLVEELSYWHDGFQDTWRQDHPDESARLVPFGFSLVPVGETRGMGEAVHAVLIRAQRAWRRGEGRAAVLPLIRTALDRYRSVDAPDSPVLTAAARDLGGPDAEREYRLAIRDIDRWWNHPATLGHAAE